MQATCHRCPLAGIPEVVRFLLACGAGPRTQAASPRTMARPLGHRAAQLPAHDAAGGARTRFMVALAVSAFLLGRCALQQRDRAPRNTQRLAGERDHPLPSLGCDGRVVLRAGRSSRGTRGGWVRLPDVVHPLRILEASRPRSAPATAPRPQGVRRSATATRGCAPAVPRAGRDSLNAPATTTNGLDLVSIPFVDTPRSKVQRSPGK